MALGPESFAIPPIHEFTYYVNMLPLDPADPLFNAVLETLSRSPGITVADLQKKLAQRKVRVTLQHVYRVVTKLEDAQVIIKRKRELSLNLLWLSYIELFAQGARERLLKSRDLSMIDELGVGDRASLPASSLHEVQTLWYHLLIHVHKLVPGPGIHDLYKYYSHAYWLLRPDADIDFYERIAKLVRCTWLIGNESFLDCEAQERYKKVFAIAVADKPPFPAEGYLLNILGDYVIECVLPQGISDHFALLFSSVKTDTDWKPELLESLFHLTGSFTVTVWRNPDRAKELTAKIERLMPKRVGK